LSEHFSEPWIKLKPEEKVNLTVSMVDVVVSVCADNERQKNRGMNDKELIIRLRKRFQRTRLLGVATNAGLFAVRRANSVRAK